MSLYPVNMDVSGMLCLVFGGGSVASRKVDSLLPCGAEIRVISPEVCSRLADLAKAGLLEWQQKGYSQGDLDGAKLVFAATNSPEVQKQIVAEATAALIPVNVSDMPGACTFQVPASCRQGDLLLTVATGGGSPALAARIRRELEASYGPEYGLLVALMADLRKEIVGSNDWPAENKILFENLLDSDILEHISQQRWADLGALLRDVLPDEIDVLRLVKEIQNHNKKQMA